MLSPIMMITDLLICQSLAWPAARIVDRCRLDGQVSNALLQCKAFQHARVEDVCECLAPSRPDIVTIVTCFDAGMHLSTHTRINFHCTCDLRHPACANRQAAEAALRSSEQA
jgi:hypothetical protein